MAALDGMRFVAPRGRAAAAALTPARWKLSDRYAVLVAISLGGYALLGKGYAYAGVPPFFVTEAVLALGVLVLAHTRCLLATFASFPMVVLAGLLLLAVVRTVPYISVYGVDAPRDSVLILYGLFAFITVALLLERPERLADAVRFLRWLTSVFVFVAPIAYLENRVSFLPRAPGWLAGSDGVFLFVRGGEVGVHLAACAIMALLGLRAVRPIWCVALIADICMVSAQSRGGMLSIILPVALVLVLTRRWRTAGAIGMAGIALLGLVYVTDVQIPLKDEDSRGVSGRQMVENLTSVFVPSDTGNLDETKQWRLMWWEKIVDYTVHGPYFWSGKGFGINLAEDDGFMVGEPGAPALRSPHSSHLNVLARLGVPGLVLWCAAGASWLIIMLQHVYLAWVRGDRSWGNLLLFIMCYWLATVIDAAFDVAIEGPMIGVWFWCLFGFGIGAVTIYRSVAARPARRFPGHDLNHSAAFRPRAATGT